MLLCFLRWAPLLVSFLASSFILATILKDYPPVHYTPHSREQQQPAMFFVKLETEGADPASPAMVLMKLGTEGADTASPARVLMKLGTEGADTASTDEQISNLTLLNKSSCVDYRDLNLMELSPVHHRPPPPIIRTSVRKALMAEEVYGVETFVFFVGYPRSGHSIVGSIMDAHPNMIIAHEYNLFREWEKATKKHAQRMGLYNALYKNSVENALTGWRSEVKSDKGYTLGVESSWQANFTTLKVIGDKSGAVTSQFFDTNPDRFVEILEELKRTVRVPIRVIHVVRNPYDMISTRLLYADAGGKKKSKLPATKERKHCNPHGLGYQTNRTFLLINSAHNLLKKTNLTSLTVHHSDLVAIPKETVSMICHFLDLPCPADYLDACAKKVYGKPSKTRLLVTWPQTMVEEVQRLSKPYSFLSRYSFEGS